MKCYYKLRVGTLNKILSLSVSSFFLSTIGAKQERYFIYNPGLCYKKALDKNWDVQISHKHIDKSQSQIDEAYANAFPRLEFTGKYIRNIKLPVMFIPPNPLFNPTDQTMQLELDSKNSFDAAFTLSQVIYNQKVNTAMLHSLSIFFRCLLKE